MNFFRVFTNTFELFLSFAAITDNLSVKLITNKKIYDINVVQQVFSYDYQMGIQFHKIFT
jgi:hypothetical protein